MACSKINGGKPYVSYGQSTGRKIWVLESLIAALQILEKDKNSNYHLRYIYNRIKTLHNPSSTYHSREKSHITDKRSCKLNMAGSELEYYMKDGETFIDRLILSDAAYDDARKKGTIAGLNKVEQNKSRKWRVVGPADTIKTRHIAVNGDAYDIDETLLFMPKMIARAHPKESYFLTNGNEAQKGYSAFFSPCKKGSDGGWQEMQRLMLAQGAMSDAAVHQAIVDRLSATLELAGTKNNPRLNWTI